MKFVSELRDTLSCPWTHENKIPATASQNTEPEQPSLSESAYPEVSAALSAPANVNNPVHRFLLLAMNSFIIMSLKWSMKCTHSLIKYLLRSTMLQAFANSA